MARAELGYIPRAIEVLIKKAAVDPEFRQILLEKRADAAREIDLPLTMVEANMLNAVPAGQLTSIIANTKVARDKQKTFLGWSAVAMLAAVGAVGDRLETGSRIETTTKTAEAKSLPPQKAGTYTGRVDGK